MLIISSNSEAFQTVSYGTSEGKTSWRLEKLRWKNTFLYSKTGIGKTIGKKVKNASPICQQTFF